MYEKIAALIARNDFYTADKLLKKHDMSLTQEQKEALQKLAETKLRENQRAARKSEKNEKRVSRWHGHWRTVLPLEIKLGKILQIGLSLFVPCLFFPYLKRKLYAWPEKFEILTMEILLLAYLLMVSLFCGLAFMDAHTNKIGYREAKHRAGKPNRSLSELHQAFQHRENKYTKEERRWLSILIFFLLWSFVQLWHVCSSLGAQPPVAGNSSPSWWSATVFFGIVKAERGL